MKIRFELSQESVGKAIAELKASKEAVNKKTEMLASRLAELASEVAGGIYGSGVAMTVERGEGMFVVHASGRAVCFLEFGAGTRTDTSHEFANMMPFEVRPGSWSEQNAQQFSTKGFWIFGGRKYEYVTPRKGMYYADVEIRNRVYQIAKEVFHD